MANEKYKEVTKEEFDKFIKDYPNTISWDTCGIFDPPKTMAHDFTLYHGWEAVIAYITRYSMHPIELDYVDDKYYIACGG